MDGSFPGDLYGRGLEGIDVHSVGAIGGGQTYKEIKQLADGLDYINTISQ